MRLRWNPVRRSLSTVYPGSALARSNENAISVAAYWLEQYITFFFYFKYFLFVFPLLDFMKLKTYNPSARRDTKNYRPLCTAVYCFWTMKRKMDGRVKIFDRAVRHRDLEFFFQIFKSSIFFILFDWSVGVRFFRSRRSSVRVQRRRRLPQSVAFSHRELVVGA